jgi:hypothetical protein
VTDLSRGRAMLEQQRDKDGGVGTECVERAILFGRVDENLADSAIGEMTDVHSKAVTGVLNLKCNGTPAIR